MTMIENWPGRGYYRGNKQAMIADAMRLGSAAVILETKSLSLSEIDRKPPPPSIAATVTPTLMSVEEARGKGYTGNSCQDCGSVKMKIAGHCEVCEDCGSSSGCS